MPRIECHDSLPSTNDYARQHLANYQHLDVIWALEQKAGRGRGHKSWDSLTQKGLTFSIIIKKKEKFTSPALTIFVATTICRALKNNDNLAKNSQLSRLGIKWPNDILLNNKKMAGILIDDTPTHSIVGIGINVLHNQEDLLHLNKKIAQLAKKDQKSPYFATSLLAETKIKWEIKEVLAAIHQQCLKDYEIYEKEGLKHFVKCWEHCSTHTKKTEMVSHKDHGIIKKAKLCGIDEKGVWGMTKNDEKTLILWENIIDCG